MAKRVTYPAWREQANQYLSRLASDIDAWSQEAILKLLWSLDHPEAIRLLRVAQENDHFAAYHNRPASQ